MKPCETGTIESTNSAELDGRDAEEEDFSN